MKVEEGGSDNNTEEVAATISDATFLGNNCNSNDSEGDIADASSKQHHSNKSDSSGRGHGGDGLNTDTDAHACQDHEQSASVHNCFVGDQSNQMKGEYPSVAPEPKSPLDDDEGLDGPLSKSTNNSRMDPDSSASEYATVHGEMAEEFKARPTYATIPTKKRPPPKSPRSNQSIQSTSASPSRGKKSATKAKTTQYIPLKSPSNAQSSADKSSLLTRGMSLFASSRFATTRSSDNNDANSVVSEMTQDTRSGEKLSATYAASERKSYDDGALGQHLEESGLVLLKRLIEFLSECPPAPEESMMTGGRRSKSSSSSSPQKKKRQRGLTLPASAIGWLSSQINNEPSGNNVNDFDIGAYYPVPKQQLECLQMLFNRVTSLRISGEAWPPPHASASKTTTAGDATAAASKGSLSSRIISKFSADQSVGEDSLDDESCATTPSRAGTNAADLEVAISPFQRYYHELQYKPNVDMSFFPNATKIVIDGIPPHWVTNLDTLQKLEMFQMEKGCILDVNQLFFPSDLLSTKSSSKADLKKSPLSRDLSLIDEGKEKEELSSFGDDNKKGYTSLVVYPSLSKLRLSNCAMGETAGLRGRASSSSVPRVPTLSRFPNLTSLNLSRNELFKKKTVFAGLSSLPLLSSIDLSYNRLSSMDNIFMHIGNVTELILTGNEITSTRGLDRLFSLERLSMDENKIHTLANIAGIAKIPFLMNFDLKGNPLEIEDPASCRIKVFNLFREVRCSNLPKNATFRDMQGLLPILDHEVATKDELVALKDLTFRQTVTPADSMLSSESKGGSTDVGTIDESSEISVNMPDQSGGLRRVVKTAQANRAHLRMAGSLLLEATSTERLEHFHDNLDSGVAKERAAQFNMKDLIGTIRPQLGKGLSSNFNEQDGSLHTGMARAKSSSSHYNGIEDVTGNSLLSSFPYDVPSSLLAEANDEVWTQTSQLDQIAPAQTIIWDMPSSDGFVELDDTGGLTWHPNDNAELEETTQSNPPSPNAQNETPSSDSGGELVKQNPTMSMFDDIWEKSYQENMMRNDIKDSNKSTERAKSELLDFNAAEQISQYDGPADYESLYVSSDLDLYFDSFVFHRESSEEGENEGDSGAKHLAPRIQLFKFDRDLVRSRASQHGSAFPSSIDFSEKYVGVWKEDVLACGSYARSRLAPVKLAKRGFHGDIETVAGKDVMMSESRKFILCLSDAALYFIIDDDISSQQSAKNGERTFPSRIAADATFGDAHWPHAVVRHPLDCLRGITIGFQFQRLILRFSVGMSASSSTTLDYVYVILTSNKLQTVSLLQKLQSHVPDTSNVGSLIDNDDKTFLDALGAPKSNEVVLHYQILHQIWKRGERAAARRAFVLTDARAFLLDEIYTGDGTRPDEEKKANKKLGDVTLSIIDSAKLSRVTEIRAANEDPTKITLVILPQNKLMRSHRWRLVCNDGEGAERLIDDVRKAIKTHSM